MNNEKSKVDDIAVYIEDREYIANKYVLRCFTVTMLVYTMIFVLNLLGIFVIEQEIMVQGYIPSVIIYLVVYFICKSISLSNEKIKYFILFSVVMVFTIIGVSVTYHAVLVAILPFLYATLYSSKRVMYYVYGLTVVSTIVVVYGGYFYGLCDANMALLTVDRLQDYVQNGQFVLTEVNPNPHISLMIFYVVPRCLIYIAFASVGSSIFRIVSGSLEKAKLTAELERAKIEAENANRAKSQFLARMSHEIRTPINAVMGINEMILRESSENDIRQYAQDVKDSSVILLNLINEILDSTKLEVGMMELVPVDYDLGSLLNDLYNMISIRVKEKGLELEFVIDSAIPRSYYGDDKRIRQVVVNLLTNAVKYTNRGKITLEVTGRTEGEDAVLHFAVRDTGIGIREEDIGKLYKEFQRLDMSRNRQVEGTGLGLNLVQQFLKLMGSELHLHSEYEKGSEFAFDIVQKIVDARPLGDFKERIEQVADEKVYHSGYTASAAKILVVDDSTMNLKVFKGLLKETGIQVSEALSGMECLDMVRKQDFDLIFLDHMMPEMDGIETLHAIRDNKLCEGIPIVMLTANAIVGDKEKYLEEGFTDFLSKPIMPGKLDEMILKYLPEELVAYKASI